MYVLRTYAKFSIELPLESFAETFRVRCYCGQISSYLCILFWVEIGSYFSADLSRRVLTEQSPRCLSTRVLFLRVSIHTTWIRIYIRTRSYSFTYVVETPTTQTTRETALVRENPQWFEGNKKVNFTRWWTIFGCYRTTRFISGTLE